MAVKTWKSLYWTETPCSPLGRYLRCEENTASIFRDGDGKNVSLEEAIRKVQENQEWQEWNEARQLLVPAANDNAVRQRHKYHKQAHTFYFILVTNLLLKYTRKS
jgi:hypothetical protein